jgi:hypothetical protein
VAQTIGSSYTVTIPTLSDPASIVEAFRYYHTGRNDAGPALSNSVEQHLTTANTNIASLQTAIGWPYSNGSNINARLLSLEAGSGNVAGLYIKSGPSSNVTSDFKNEITPQNTSTIPLMIKGINGGTATDLQQWFVYGDSNPKVKITGTGRLYAFDGTSVDEVATINGTQVLANKIINQGVLTVATTTATMDLTYRGKFVNFVSTSAKTVTIPHATNTVGPTGPVNFPIGTEITITNLAASGNMTLVGVTGVTLLSQDNRVLIYPYGSVKLFKVDANNWTLNFMSKERQTFIQQTDPGAAALDGDIWYKY